MKMEHILPADIERRSFEVIEKELQGRIFPAENSAVIKRVIHTTADFDYADNLYFSPNAVTKGKTALAKGCAIVTDTQMGKAGINKKALARFGCEVYCFMSDADVAEEAKRRGVTRAVVSMEKAARLAQPLIFAIGNAPTALITLHELLEAGKIAPELIIAVPVGFVNVVEAKELIIKSVCANITARGRKGGSNVAAAICNALLYDIDGIRE